jgi:tetratricopeptide (TPR) repeat protein
MQLYRFINRKWFGIAVGLLVLTALLFSFALIFNWLPGGGNLALLWDFLRFVLAALVLVSWAILNITPPRPTGFVIAFAELGQEPASGAALNGFLKPARRGFGAIFGRAYRPAYPDAELDSFTHNKVYQGWQLRRQAAPGLALANSTGSLQMAREEAPSGQSILTTTHPAGFTSASRTRPPRPGLPGEPPGRRAESPSRTAPADLNQVKAELIPARPGRLVPPAWLFAWETATGPKSLTTYLQPALQSELTATDLKEAVSFYPLVFVKNRAAALREGSVYNADCIIWGWNVYAQPRRYVPVFELKEALEDRRPNRGQMQILGLSSFDLGNLAARHSTIFRAFAAGLAAYGSAGENPSRPEQHFYLKARAAFSQALIGAYMYEAASPPPEAYARSILYFFLGNTYYYLNDLEQAANAYREALAADEGLIEARHNMGVVLFLQRQYDLASRNLINVIQLCPELAVARLNLAVLYLAKKQVSAARRELNNALKLNPRLAAAYRLLGISYREEDYSAAVRYLEEALRVSPGGKNAEARVELGLVYAGRSVAADLSTGQAFSFYQQGIRQLQQAIEDNPTLPEAHYHLARLLYRAEREDEAGLALLEAVRLRPAYSEAHALLAEIFEKRGRIDLRDKHLESMMKARQESAAATPEEHLQRGIGARLTRDFGLAREELEKALRLEPRNSGALFELGIVFQEMGDLDKALSSFQAVLKLPEPPLEVYNRLSNLKFQQGDRQGSLDLLRQVAADRPEAARLHYYLGNAYRKQKTEGKAIESYVKAIQLDPALAEPHFNLGLIYFNRRQFNDALLQFGEVVRLRPEDYEAYLFLGRAYRSTNRLANAVVALEEAISLKTDFLEARLLLGEIYLRQGELDQAIEQLLMVQTYNPTDLRARELMGKAYAQAGQLERAIEIFQDIIVVSPANPSAHYNLGISYVSQRRYREAAGEFMAVVQNKADDADAYFNLGVALHELLNGPDQVNLEASQVDTYFNQEVESFSKAIQLSPAKPEPYRYLGQLYSRTNQMELALKYLNEYQRLKKLA